MSEIPGYTLEEYVDWDNWGICTPELMEKYEPYREVIENWLDDFDEENMSWRGYAAYCPINIDIDFNEL
jgi:hypothetical protein